MTISESTQTYIDGENEKNEILLLNYLRTSVLKDLNLIKSNFEKSNSNSHSVSNAPSGGHLANVRTFYTDNLSNANSYTNLFETLVLRNSVINAIKKLSNNLTLTELDGTEIDSKIENITLSSTPNTTTVQNFYRNILANYDTIVNNLYTNDSDTTTLTTSPTGYDSIRTTLTPSGTNKLYDTYSKKIK